MSKQTMRDLALTTLAFVALASGCGPLDDYAPSIEIPTPDAGTGGAADGGRRDGGGIEGQFVPADILFVIDSSGSMADEQLALSTNIDAFIQELAGTGSYRIGVISTEMDYGASPAGGQWAGQQVTSYSAVAPYYGTTGVDRSGCSTTGIPFGCFRPYAGKRFADSELDSPAEQISFVSAATQLGTCGSGIEAGYDATALALDKMMGVQCNAGFLRPEANLVVIFVTDEDEGSMTHTSTAALFAAIAQHKDLARVRMAVIGGTRGIEAVACGAVEECGVSACAAGRPTDPGLAPLYDLGCNWCAFMSAPDCCTALPASRYVAGARALEREVAMLDPRITVSDCAGAGAKIACRVESICAQDFSAAMVRIARDLIKFQTL